MKIRKIHHFFIYTAIVLLHLSCAKDHSTTMDSPDQRIADSTTKYDQILTSDDGVWKMSFFTKSGPGYNFLFKFLDNGRVEMLSDIDQQTASSYNNSSYRIKFMQRPSLIFDTYNYIHIINDPNPSIMGGGRALGRKADFDFAILEALNSEFDLLGNFNKNEVKLKRLGQAEFQQIDNKGWWNSLNQFKTFRSKTKFPYFETEEGVVSLEIDSAERKVKTYLVQNGVVKGKDSLFYMFDVDRIVFNKQLVFGGLLLDTMHWDHDHEHYFVLNQGSKTVLKGNTQPNVPLSGLLGYGKDFTYLNVGSRFLHPGITSDFNNTWDETLALMRGSGRTILYANFKFVGTNSFQVHIRYGTSDAVGEPTGASQFTAIASYQFTRQGDMIKLDEGAYDGNWEVRKAQLIKLREYFENASFKIDWIKTSDPVNPQYLGGLLKDGNRQNVVYGDLM